jgi:hypothetical protein
MSELCGKALHTRKCVITCQKFRHPISEPHEFTWMEWETEDNFPREERWELEDYCND